MKVLKQVLLILTLALIVIACEDEIVNTYTGGSVSGKFGASISEISYELVFTDRSISNPSVQPGSYHDGIKLTVKLNDPSKKDSIIRMTMGSMYDFDSKSLQESYIDSIGGYYFSFRNFYLASYGGGHGHGPYSAQWILTLYDALNNPSESDTITIWSYFLYPKAQHEWISESDIEIITNGSYGANAKVETRLFNASGTEIKNYQSDVYNNKWILSDVPNEAVYFQFICTDINGGIKRTAISGKYTIKTRFSDNVELINDIESPYQMEYLEGIDKILSLSRDLKKLTLINYEDNAVVWKRDLNFDFPSFAYSPERNSIYLAYSNGLVEYINPENGSAQELFSCNYMIGSLLIAGDYLVPIPNWSTNYINYNLESKTTSGPYPIGLPYSDHFSELFGAEYDRGSKIAYVIDHYSNIFTFDFVDTTGTLKYREQQYGPFIGGNIKVNFKLDGTRLYNGSGRIFEIPDNASGSMREIGYIKPFSDITIIPNSYIITIGSSYRTDDAVYGPALSVYNYDLSLLKQKKDLIGTPVQIINKGNVLKAYYILSNNRLAAEKSLIEDIVNSGGN